MRQSFAFTGMPKLIFGPDSINQLGKCAATFGKHALLVTGRNSLERSGRLSRIVEHLRASGIDVRICPIAGEPSPDAVDGAVAGMRNQSVDVVMAIGGGSVIDAGKAIAAMLRESGSVADFLEGVGSRRPSGRSLPMIAVPTTSGTGSEATKNAVISRIGDDGFKNSLRHDNYIPKIAIVDPLLCVSAPLSVTAACGMDALTQLIESYVSTQASPLTDTLALAGMEYLIPALPLACGEKADDVGCRGAVALGAFISGVTLAHAGLGVIHGVAGPLGGVIAIPHGVACANLLPFGVEATIEALKMADTEASAVGIGKFARIGRRFGARSGDPLADCRHLVASLYQWLNQLAIPRLGRFGLTEAHADRLIPMASNKNNPLSLSNDQIKRMILDRC